jgi:hypothetical protein
MRRFTDTQRTFQTSSIGLHCSKIYNTRKSPACKDKLGVEIGADHFNHVSAELKQDLKNNLKHLQKDRFAYIRGFFDRIEEISYTQKRLWKLMEDNPDKPILQKVVYLSSINQQ